MAIIEQLRFEHIASCEKVLRQLPAWFGIEQAIRNYASDLERCDGLWQPLMERSSPLSA